MYSQAPNTVLVTGVTGFLGKVVLEELLRQQQSFSFSGVAVIVRGRNSLDGDQRFWKETAASKCFSKLPSNWKESVKVLDGELSLPHCGLSNKDYGWVVSNVTHIIHVAGYIKFDGEVSAAVQSNVMSALNMLNLAKACKYLQRLVTTSTAYSVPPSTAPIYENLVPLPVPANELYSDLIEGKLSKKDATSLTRHPNIYSLSKCLAEHLLVEQHNSVPLTIVRPSIICAAWKYPFPGWIDSKAAFGGFAASFAAGILCVVDGRRDAKLDIVPVDEVAACLIVEAFRVEERPIISLLPPRIVFCVATTSHSFTLDEACQLLTSFFKSRRLGPRTPAFRYIGPRNLAFHIYDMIYHQMPSRTTAAIMRIMGKEKEAANARRACRITSAMNVVFAPYTNHTYDFRPAQNVVNFDKIKYMRRICEGTVEYLIQPKL